MKHWRTIFENVSCGERGPGSWIMPWTVYPTRFQRAMYSFCFDTKMVPNYLQFYQHGRFSHFKLLQLHESSLFCGSDKDQTLIVKHPSKHSFLYCSCLGTSTLCGSITLTWKHGEQSDVLVAPFSLLAEHVPTVVNLSMYRALVGTV